MEKDNMPYSVIDTVLTKYHGRNSYYAYKSFATLKEAEKFRKNRCIAWRAKVIKE